MQAKASIQYTVRGVPPEIDEVLRKKAGQRKQSLNQVILNELAAVTIGKPRRADFSQFVGAWIPDPGFDEIISSQRQIDWEKWK